MAKLERLKTPSRYREGVRILTEKLLFGHLPLAFAAKHCYNFLGKQKCGSLRALPAPASLCRWRRTYTTVQDRTAWNIIRERRPFDKGRFCPYSMFLCCLGASFRVCAVWELILRSVFVFTRHRRGPSPTDRRGENERKERSILNGKITFSQEGGTEENSGRRYRLQ